MRIRTRNMKRQLITFRRRHHCFLFFSSRRRHTRYWRDWSSDVCSSDLFSMSEPGLGSDVAGIRTKAVKQADGGYVIDGQKMWLTNGGSSTLVAALVRTDEGAEKAHQNLTTFLVEKPAGFGEVVPGLTIPGKIDKMGYKGVDTTELVFDGYQAKASDILGGAPGKGFSHMMDGVEVGRVNVAARACGISIRADRKSTRLNSSHANISYDVFCSKKKYLSRVSY